MIDGANIMAQIWKTDMISRDDRCIGYMACVWLPVNDEKVCMEVQEELRTKYNTYLPMGKFDGIMFTRVCGQIYNELEDYRKTAEIFLEILKNKKLVPKNKEMTLHKK